MCVKVACPSLTSSPSPPVPPTEPPTPPSTLSQSASLFLLLLTTLIWGSQHSIIKMTVEEVDPATFSAARFAVATIAATLPFIFSKSPPASSVKTSCRWGLELGLWMLMGYGFQAISLETTLAARSAPPHPPAPPRPTDWCSSLPRLAQPRRTPIRRAPPRTAPQRRAPKSPPRTTQLAMFHPAPVLSVVPC